MSRETGGIKLIRECLSLSFELQSLIQAGMFQTIHHTQNKWEYLKVVINSI